MCIYHSARWVVYSTSFEHVSLHFLVIPQSWLVKKGISMVRSLPYHHQPTILYQACPCMFGGKNWFKPRKLLMNDDQNSSESQVVINQ